jgi:plastocyanin
MVVRKLLVQMIVLLSAVGIIYAGGSITGTITFEGKAPKMKPLKVDADPICVANNEIAPKKEWLILDENKGVKNVLVFITEGLNIDDSPPEEPMVIDQKGCIYSPHVVGIMAGQQLDILNNDGTLHNIHALPKVNKEFNKAQPRSKKKLSVKFEKPEAPFKIKCDVHPWMGAYIGVFDHPCFSVSGDDGTYIISDLKPGEYVIEAWHEKLGSQTANVTVSDSAAHQDFTFKKPSKKK